MSATGADAQAATFSELGLDLRLLRALEKREYVKPTPVQVRVTLPGHTGNISKALAEMQDSGVMYCLSLMQAACVPAALEGKDIIARAQTGSGKTLAYLLPALNKILALPKDRQRAGWQALIYVPTRELCEQVGPLNAVHSPVISRMQP